MIVFIFVGCLPDYIYYGKSCYYFSKTSLYWEPSRKFCKDHGSDLAIINDANENNLIVQHLKQLTAQHVLPSKLLVCLLCLMVFNATFNNISVILWRSVLLVEETGGPGEYHRPSASHWQNWSHNVVHLALIAIRTHNISVLPSKTLNFM